MDESASGRAVCRLCDLHTHSTASDGRLSPSALVSRAASRGVKRLALTDHDTVAGVAEASTAGQRHGVAIVAGTEISASWQNKTLHIVGLGVDPAQPTLQAGLARQQAARDERAADISRRLAHIGLHDGLARIRANTADGQITRAHFADLLVADRLARNRQDAFKRYLRPGRPGYRRTLWAEMADVIGWIHAAGGQAILAHPFGYGLSGNGRRRTVAAFARAHGDGLEICTGASNTDQESQSVRDAQRHELAGSIGSDFHAPEQFWLDIGKTRPLPINIPPVAALSSDDSR